MFPWFIWSFVISKDALYIISSSRYSEGSPFPRHRILKYHEFPTLEKRKKSQPKVMEDHGGGLYHLIFRISIFRGGGWIFSSFSPYIIFWCVPPIGAKTLQLSRAETLRKNNKLITQKTQPIVKNENLHQLGWMLFLLCVFFPKMQTTKIIRHVQENIRDKPPPLTKEMTTCSTITRWWFQIFFIFTPILGEDSHFDEHMFQMSWNHLDQFLTENLVLQPEVVWPFHGSCLALCLLPAGVTWWGHWTCLFPQRKLTCGGYPP